MCIKNCPNKNGAVIKINYFPFRKACKGRKLTQTAREMRKHPFHIVLRARFHNLSLPQMPFLPCPCSLLLRAVLSPSSSIKLSHVFLWSAVHSLSHHYTISLPTSCWNSTLRQPFSCSLVPQSLARWVVLRLQLHCPEGACAICKQTHRPFL